MNIVAGNKLEVVYILYERVLLNKIRVTKIKLLGTKVGMKLNITGKIKITGSHCNVAIGNNCVINYGTFINARGNVIIGDNVRLSSFTKIYTGIHEKNCPKNHKSKDVIIEDNVWIASDSIILGGVTIGRNSIVGAGSVVTKSVPEYSLCVGNPSKIIKKLQ